ncbi:uncharacterized protein J4E92_007112 [Alternaria infectoria]|uniref:uncharacterized protein n=1 Tax=Alternaria infectoria TaxID=45303 RepID=UPI0022202418|nr:uncharacterized protein J4E92_007112 [Alternaria infectoria]KAI4925074.1 hypothetical protein J4E92_007112 [Alternaria infectoria]
MKNQYAVDVTSGPSFKLYYCVGEDPAFELQWGSSSVSLGGSDQPLSLCGTRMLTGQHTQTPPSSEATVSCLLEINGDFYALGPAHLFTQKITAKFQEHLLAELRQMDEDEDDGDDITFDDDDDGYSDDNHSSPNDLMSEERSLKGNATPSPPKVLDDPSSDEVGLEDLVARYPGPKDLQEDITDCDWAVTQVKKPDQQLPNLYLAEGEQAPEFRHIVDVADEDLAKWHVISKMEISVRILTSSSTKYGTILPQFANISGLSGRGHCNVYVVSMNSGDGKHLASITLFIR